MSQYTQINLIAKGCSGRGIRFKLLNPLERDQASIDAAKVSGKNASNLQYALFEVRELINKSIVSVTKKGGYKLDSDIMALPDTEWEKVTQFNLEDPGCPFEYNKLFTPKEDSIIAMYIKSLYSPTQEDIDSILGKAVTIAMS